MIKLKKLPSVGRLEELFTYNPETGDLFRKYKKNQKLIKKNTSRGYLRPAVDGQKYYAHRICWKLYYGVCPDDQIDHINGDTSDNRIENLRIASQQENCKNRSQQKNNTSGNTGVTWNKASGKWQASISVDGKLKYLGIFTDKIDAIYARYWAEQGLGYHENHGR